MKKPAPNSALTVWHWTIREAKRYFEGLFWMTGLFYLALSDPSASTHFSFCVFNWLGIEYCPGCGLGRSISYFFHGDFYTSLVTHPLGIFAVLVLSFRIYSLFNKSVKFKHATIETDQ
jgi:hypothetical protein